jgi:hypothetical protein
MEGKMNKRKIGKWLDKVIGSHLNIGKRLTIYGDNAMNFGVTYWTKKYGYICFRLPLPVRIVDSFLYGDKVRWQPLYFYVSPNATPWASTFMLGKKHDRDDWALSRVRRVRLGHNWNTNDEEKYLEMRRINGMI